MLQQQTFQMLTAAYFYQGFIGKSDEMQCFAGYKQNYNKNFFHHKFP